VTETATVKAEEKLFLKALPGKVLVLEDAFEYKGRIVIPEVAQRRPTTGTIVSIGEGASESWKEPLAVGDRVAYSQFSGVLLNFKNRPDYRVLGVEELLAQITTETDVLEGTGT